MTGVEDQVSFDVEDALFDRVPYRPWRSPLGTVRAGADPGDRRVIGRLDGEPVSITDLPPHVVHRSDPPGYAHTHQYFERGRDFVDWVVNTAAGTRFVGAGQAWDEQVRSAVAAQAVRAGLGWDSNGNILVMSPPGYNSPLASVPSPRRRYRLRPAGGGKWVVCVAEGPDSLALVGADLSEALDGPLSDVCCDGDLLSFEVEMLQ